jgi:hypothetical protein
VARGVDGSCHERPEYAGLPQFAGAVATAMEYATARAPALRASTPSTRRAISEYT